jgi:hypothetical protein
MPDGLDSFDGDVIPARPWGGWVGVGFVECVGYVYVFDSVHEIGIRHAQADLHPLIAIKLVHGLWCKRLPVKVTESMKRGVD